MALLERELHWQEKVRRHTRHQYAHELAYMLLCRYAYMSYQARECGDTQAMRPDIRMDEKAIGTRTGAHTQT